MEITSVQELRKITEEVQNYAREKALQQTKLGKKKRREEIKVFLDEIKKDIYQRAAEEARSGKNFLHVLRVDQVALFRSEVWFDRKSRRLAEPAQDLYRWCEQQKLNPRIIDIYGDDGMGINEFKGTDLVISW